MPANDFIDMAGKTYGKWKVLRYSHGGSGAVWHCRCECGNEADVRGIQLRKGKSTQCQACGSAQGATIHGHTSKRARTSTYKTWAGMVKRCNSPKHKHYRHYGGRGITVCERWLKFENFLADMGERPARTTIDRIDVNGNYEQSNCRWADDETQRKNKRNSKTKGKA